MVDNIRRFSIEPSLTHSALILNVIQGMPREIYRSEEVLGLFFVREERTYDSIKKNSEARKKG